MSADGWLVIVIERRPEPRKPAEKSPARNSSVSVSALINTGVMPMKILKTTMPGKAHTRNACHPAKSAGKG